MHRDEMSAAMSARRPAERPKPRLLTMEETMMSGKFFWYDVMTTDTAAARNFYCKVVGWQTQGGSGAAGMEYTVFTVNGRGVAGLMPIPEDARRTGVRPAWM